MEQSNRLTLERIYNAPIHMVWEALTDPEKLKEWYFDFAAEWKLAVGHSFDWYAGEPGGKQWLHRGKMIEIIEGKKLSHTWKYPGYSGSSLVIWELESLDTHRTKLVFTHEFTMPFDADVEALRRESFEAGWDHIIHIGLKEFLEKV